MNSPAHSSAPQAVLPPDQPVPPYRPGGKLFALSTPRALLYILAATILSWTQGLGMNMVQANIAQIQGGLHATTLETTWLIGAYMAPNVSLSFFLIKIRTRFGLRNFAELSIIGMVLVNLLHLAVTDWQTTLIVRFIAGIAAAPMSSLGFLYMIEAFVPARKRTTGLSLNLMNVALSMPLARLVGPSLIEAGGFHGLYALEIALALIGFALIFYLPLTPTPRAKVIEKLDLVSYSLIAAGLGINAAIMPVGRLYWWREASWIGAGLVITGLCLAAAALIELNRKNPLIDLRWLFSREMLHIAIVLMIFRVLLSEQSTLAANFFNLFGLLNRELYTLNLLVIAGTICGGLICAAFLKPGREDAFHIAALVLLATGSWLDSHATNLTRPPNMYVSQTMIGLGGALFLPPSMFKGLGMALTRGPQYILSFIAVFLFTQNTGGLMSSAFFGSLQTMFEKYHSNILAQTIVMSDPIVAARVVQLGQPWHIILSDPALLQAEGLAILGRQATLEANILAYNDVFRIYTLIALALLAFLLLRIMRTAFIQWQKNNTALAAESA
ncbi:MAG: Major facilitator superfamily transporter [Candidatus Tokpelaia hoelldobleri]|uniref:Major facilitator superfamily transporter n=1 Tax=Candidatus Tokpelaia hoelldobleri TaxID=1902579 RepID=A0A1U9JSJ9_9HYPH|nr:MAG: Major facilitator superfamily transporter [Candidatus Tokpelaia hoelldoblerii]